jgi:hypothetical protein
MPITKEQYEKMASSEPEPRCSIKYDGLNVLNAPIYSRKRVQMEKFAGKIWEMEAYA